MRVGDPGITFRSTVDGGTWTVRSAQWCCKDECYKIYDVDGKPPDEFGKDFDVAINPAEGVHFGAWERLKGNWVDYPAVHEDHSVHNPMTRAGEILEGLRK